MRWLETVGRLSVYAIATRLDNSIRSDSGVLITSFLRNPIGCSGRQLARN